MSAPRPLDLDGLWQRSLEEVLHGVSSVIERRWLTATAPVAFRNFWTRRSLATSVRREEKWITLPLHRPAR